MDYKLIIFSDGALTTTKSGQQFRSGAADWQWLPGRLGKLRELRGGGMRLAVATNQGGVGFGHFTQAAILAELMRMMQEGDLPQGGLYVCYTHPYAHIEQYRAEDARRKPEPGMLLEAMRDFEALPEETLSVGNRPEDQQAAKNAGVTFLWANEFFKGVAK